MADFQDRQKTTLSGTPDIKMLDLFAGAGGLTSGFKNASSRFTTTRAVEWDHQAAASYEATFGRDLVHAGSIESWLRNEDVPNVDLVIGGPPCQGFSSLGKQHVEDERNSLWQKYAETIVRASPQYFVMENVAEFAKSPQYESFRASTEAGGILQNYVFQHAILNAADFGVPQARKRAIIIGHHKDLEFPGFPTATHKERGGPQPRITVSDALRGVPLTPDADRFLARREFVFQGKTYQGAFSLAEMHWSRNYSTLSRSRFETIPPGGNRFDIPDELLAPCWRKHKSGSGDVMGRLHWDKPSVTIRTEFFKPEKGRYLHPTENRAITHYEAALLQGFGADHRFVGSRTAIARQIGNAVPIQLGTAIARTLLDRLGS